jgi:hypothetical protein
MALKHGHDPFGFGTGAGPGCPMRRRRVTLRTVKGGLAYSRPPAILISTRVSARAYWSFRVTRGTQLGIILVMLVMG